MFFLIIFSDDKNKMIHMHGRMSKKKKKKK